jgi:aryl-alcohol dehydrogenase-like predicted oxidoreductase
MKVMFKSNYFSFLEELSVIAKRYKCSLTEISIAWLLSHSIVTSVINGVRNVKQLKENIKSSGIQINKNDLILIESMYEKHFK